MAGPIDRGTNQPNGIGGRIRKLAAKLTNSGLDFNPEVVQQSMAVSNLEAQTDTLSYAMDKDLLMAAKAADQGVKKDVAIFNKRYPERVNDLRTFASNGEIENILDIISDESIIYDNMNYFCQPDNGLLSSFLKKDDESTSKILKRLNVNFKLIYSYFHFSDGISAWQLYKQWLIEGFLAFEIVYNKERTKVIGFMQLDPLSLRPDIQKIGNEAVKIWHQYENQGEQARILLDSQIIYISYNMSNVNDRISYLERLVRSFNIMRLMENSRVIWNIMNATFRMKMIVPIPPSRKDAKESIGELRNQHVEDYDFDDMSGQISINGSASIPYYKNYLLPSKGGEHPEIETVSGDGPDLQDVQIVEYFRRKMQVESGIPLSRFEEGNSDGYEFDSANGIARDEVKFGRFIKRLQTTFQELLLKPVYLQMVLEFPELKNDFLFKTSMGLEFNSNNIFSDLRDMDIMQKKMDFVGQMKDFSADTDGVFSTTYLLRKYMGITEDELKTNRDFVKADEKFFADDEAGGDDW